MKTISKKKLLNYIEHEQIAFQFSDGLLCFTHSEGDFGNENLDQSIIDDFEEMKNFIIDSRNITIVSKEDVYSKNDQFGFNEFANWATDRDLLILVDKELLLCLPFLFARNIIFDVA